MANDAGQDGTDVGSRRGGEMKSPDAPLAMKGFFVTHFLTVKDQARSKEFYVGILGGKVVKPEIHATSSWKIPGLFSTRAEGYRAKSTVKGPRYSGHHPSC